MAALDPTRGPSRQILTTLGVVGAAMVVLLGWSYHARIDISAMGTGQVIPNRRLQVVQNLEGGILQELMVKEGATVKSGQPLARFSDTEFSASLGEAGATFGGYEAQLTRLSAEVAAADQLARGGSPGEPTFSPALQSSHPELIAKESQLFHAHMDNLRAMLSEADQVIERAQNQRQKAQENIPLLDNQLKLAGQQRAILEPQLKRGLVSKLELLAVDQRVLEIRGKMVEAQRDIHNAVTEAAEAQQRRRGEVQKFRGETLAQLTDTKVKAEALKAQMGNLQDRVKRRVVTAPVNGVVKHIFANTVGAVLKAGDELLEIVPSDDERIVEARFSPSDIAFIQKDQPAYIRITAYDSSIYGSIPAVVSEVSADATTTQRDEVFYLVQVRAKGVLHDRTGKELKIVPGMVAQVDVLTGKRRLLDYWLKPITRVRYTALHER